MVFCFNQKFFKTTGHIEKLVNSEPENPINTAT
jgi:hypothetical protein